MSQKTTRKVSIFAVRSKRRFGKFDLGKVVLHELQRQKVKLQNGDVLIVSSKFAAMSEGRYLELAKINPSRKAKDLSRKYEVDAHLSQIIIEESEAILGGIPGFTLAVSKGILAPNAGIDRSNVPPGFAILYPANPQDSANRLRHFLVSRCLPGMTSKKLGVVFSDSRVTPTRLGTIGIAIAAAGFEPVLDFRGIKDLFGNTLKVTLRAFADELASAAQLVMGEAAESTPIVVIRGCNAKFTEESQKISSMLIPHEKCLYIQGLKRGFLENHVPSKIR